MKLSWNISLLSITGLKSPFNSLQAILALKFTTERFNDSLRANVGKYWESKISSKNSNFGYYHPNNPLGELFQEMILRNPQALYILRNLANFKNSIKIHFLIREIAVNFKNFQVSSTSAQKVLLTWCCTIAFTSYAKLSDCIKMSRKITFVI